MMHKVPLIKPNIKFQEVRLGFEEIFQSGILTNGKYNQMFMSGLKQYTGARHVFLTTSATTALALSIRALGIKSGDKVAVSDFSWPATSNVVEDIGAKPIFVDVDRYTYNMCPVDLLARIREGISAVITVDCFGNPSGITKIREICDLARIPLIQDAACSFGSRVNGKSVGTIADLSCFSFHPRKLLTTGEGGAITTNNDKIADWLSVKLAGGSVGSAHHRRDFVDFGYNYRLSEISSLIGFSQLDGFDSFLHERSQIAKNFANFLTQRGFVPQKVDKSCFHNVQSLVFTVPPGINRDQLIDYLASKNVETTFGTYCLSSTTYNRKKYNDIRPNSLWLQNNAITLPCYSGVDVKQITMEIGRFLEINRMKSNVA